MPEFDSDPYADDTEATFVGYECGWTVYAPVDEQEKVSEQCICGASLR